MKFFDARCVLGTRGFVREGEPTTKKEILEQLEGCHIAKAIAYHATAKDADTPTGNRKILEEVREDARFVPQWCAMPSAFGEVMNVEPFFAAMKHYGVSTMRLQPKTNGFSLRPYSIGKWMDAAADCKMPVFLNLDEEISVEQVYDLCQDYPHVEFVIGNVSSLAKQFLGPTLDACANLYLGVGSANLDGGLELLCKYYGAHRLLFETGLPEGAAAAAVAQVKNAQISEEEKEWIAHGNLERLLSEVKL